MYAYLRNAMGSLTAPSGAERTRRQHGAAILPLVVTVDQDPTKDMHSDHLAAADLVDRPAYSARMRVILILSVLSWILVALASTWAIGRL